MRFRVLGSLEVFQDGRQVRVPGARQQALLALLLIHANELVSSDRLIEELWGQQQPAEAPNALQAAVSRLRRALPDDETEARLETRAPGYVFVAPPDSIDSRRFERLAKEGRAALSGGDPALASLLLESALALWRGSAFADFVYEPFTQAEIARLEELRLAATEDRIEADLCLGRELKLGAELEALVEAHPFRERVRGQLMLALYRSGRQAEALETYRAGRELMSSELGIEPSPPLCRLEAAILRQDAELARAPATGEGEGGAFAMPGASLSPPEGAAAPAGALKPATVVVAGLAASALDRLEPDARHQLSERYLALAGDCFGRHGGFMERRSGPLATAVFGLPLVHEDDALRAVRAAWDLNGRLPGLEAEFRAELDLRLRAGVCSGEVIAGDTSAGEAIANGDPVAAAVHLYELARPGDILVDEATYTLVAAAVDSECRPGPARADDPAVGTVRRIIDVAPASAITAPRREGRIVGRDLELDQLQQALEWTIERRTTYLFTLLGAAGIGKTRLASEFAARIRSRATVLTGRCLPYGDGITYWPLREILNAAFEDDLEAGVRELLGSAPDAAAIGQQLAAAIGLTTAPTGVEEIRWATGRVLAALAERTPLLLLFEDVHWAEPTLLDLLEYLAELSAPAPLMVVCLARPELLENRPGWGGGKPNARSLQLDALSDEQLQALLRDLDAGGRLDRAAEQRVISTAEGNPLFLEQLVTALREHGAPATRLALPATVEALLAARLDRLGPGERAVLEPAAVIGKRFELRALSELLESDARPLLVRHLERLVRRRFLRPTAEAGFRFEHVLVQQAVYRAIAPPRRGELHEHLANWLERTSVSGPEAAELCGYHLEQASRYRREGGPDELAEQLAARAARALAAAGRAASARGDMPATANLLGRAAALLPTDSPPRREVLPDLAKALMETSELERAQRVLEEATAIAERVDDQRLWCRAAVVELLQHARTHPERMRQAESHSLIERLLPALEEADDFAGLSDAWLQLALSEEWLGHSDQARSAFQLAADYARQAGDGWRELEAVGMFAHTSMMSSLPVGESARALEALRPQVARGRQAGAWIDRALALERAFHGDIDEARELCARSIQTLEELGMSLHALCGVIDRAQVELTAGDPAIAERQLRDGLDQLLAAGEHAVASSVAALLAETLSRQGRDEEAERRARQAIELGAEDDRFTQILASSALARVRAHQGCPHEAQVLAREAVATSLETDWADQQADALITLAETLRLGAHHDEAWAALREALSRYERRENDVMAARVRAELAELAG